ncbi:MAG: hypothetical protein SFY96_09630 [Planctomycetota bacterium]|nr:hypothetical protein [Planctomycetota bacterium]
MLSALTTYVIAGALLAQTPGVESTQATGATKTIATAQAHVEAQSGGASVSWREHVVAGTVMKVPVVSLRAAGSDGATPMMSPKAQAFRTQRRTALTSALRAAGLNDAQITERLDAPVHVNREPYKYAGPGWIKHPLTPEQQIQKYGTLVMPAAHGGEESQPDRFTTAQRATLANLGDTQRQQAAHGFGPRDVCSDILNGRIPPPIKFTPLGPAPLAGLDIEGDTKSEDENEFWSRMPASGRVISIACDPSIVNNVMIGTSGGGIWRTTNAQNGKQPGWTNVSDSELPFIDSSTGKPFKSDTFGLSTFGEVEYAPSDSNIVYAADGSYLDFIEGTSVFRSNDGGTTWYSVAFVITSGTTASQILVDPADPNHIYIGAASSDGSNSGNLYEAVLDNVVISGVNVPYIKEFTQLPAPDGVRSGFPGVTGLEWMQFDGKLRPAVALDGTGVYVWYEEIGLLFPITRAVGPDFRRVMLDATPDGRILLAAGVGSGGNLVGALRLVAPDFIPESLPFGTVNETGDFGLPNMLSVYGSYTGFVAIDPDPANSTHNRAFFGGVSPHLADAGLVATSTFRAVIDNSVSPKTPTWYDMSRANAVPTSVVADVDADKIERSVHPYQNAAAFDRSGNMWIAHNGGVCMVEANKLGVTNKPEFIDKNGVGLRPARNPVTTPGPLNIATAISSTFNWFAANRVITGLQGSGVGEIDGIIQADPDAPVGGVPQFKAVTGDNDVKADTSADPPEIQGRALGGDAGVALYDLRTRLGSVSGDRQPQAYMSSVVGSLRVFRRNYERTLVHQGDTSGTGTDPDLIVEAGTISPMSGSWSSDRRDNYPPMRAVKLDQSEFNQTGDDPLNPKFDTFFSGLMVATTRLWMIADPAQNWSASFNPTAPLGGLHARWKSVLSLASQLSETDGRRLLQGRVTSIGFAKPDDLRVLWFTANTGRLIRATPDRKDDGSGVPANEIKLDATTRLPTFVQSNLKKVYPPATEARAPGRAADVVVNPNDPNEVYVCFGMSTDVLNADNTVRVARVARVKFTPADPNDPMSVDQTIVTPISCNLFGVPSLKSGLTPTAIAASWGSGGNTLFVGTKSGMYVTQDDGVTWRVADPGLPQGIVRDIQLDSLLSNANAGKVLVSFEGRGVWIANNTIPPSCIADFNGDGFLTPDDFDAFADAFNATCQFADLNKDDQFTFDDVDIFVQSFEGGCE